MLRAIFQTRDDLSAFVLRLALAVVFFPHGAQKALGWFGGHGLEATLGMFTEKMHIPLFFAGCAIAAEFLGAIGLLFGFLTRVAAFGIFVTMVVAVAMVHGKFGLFMNWSGTQPGEGFEYHILVIGMCIALMIRGGGLMSVDRLLSERRTFV